jgi:predicted amidohydrolase YtcJ
MARDGGDPVGAKVESAGSARLSRREVVKGGLVVAGAALVGAPPAVSRRRHGVAADLVLTNGRVHTLDRANPAARSVAVSGGQIVYVGSDAGAKDYIGAGTDVIDLGGRMVMPGIHDGHMHPLSGGQALTAPSLGYRQLRLPAFLNAIERLLADFPGGGADTWLVVGEWDATFMPRLPTRHDLDALGTPRPIIVFSLDGHIALANSRALEIAGVTAATPDPPDGEIRRDGQGEPTGVLLDGAIGLVSSHIPPPTVEDNARALKAAFASMNRQGITSYLDASAGTSDLEATTRVSDDGELTVRPSLAITVDAELAADPEAMLEFLEGRRQTHQRPDVAIRTVKMFFDGVIEYPTQTAALLRPYLKNVGTRRHPRWVPSNNRGPTYFPQDIANAAIQALDAAGWQVHVHAIGDRAVRSALNAFEHALASNGPQDNRHTITHLELVHPNDFGRFNELAVLPSMQMQWAERDSYTVARLRPYVGDRRWRRTYPAGSLQRRGARLCGGSDWPVDPLLPFRQIEMAVNRTADEIYPGDPRPLFERQGLSLGRSIVMHTRNSAYQLHQDAMSGTLKSGLAADLVVLDRNLLEVPLTRVSKTKVLMTLVGGRVVHAGGPFEA